MLACNLSAFSSVDDCASWVNRLSVSYRGRISMKKAVTFAALLALSLVCSVLCQRATAQAVYGSVLGTVSDPQGAAVAGAKVTVTDQNKGTVTQTTTNDSGNYSVTHLLPDPYTVR